MSTPHELDIREWLIWLSMRCVLRSTENIEVLATDYASGLKDLPHDAFTPISREAAARKWESFPSYKALRKFLEEWAPQKSTALPPPLPDGVTISDHLSATDRHLVQSWWNLRPENIANGTLATALDVQRRWPTVFNEICLTDPEAAGIAVRRGWANGSNAPADVAARVKSDWETITPEQIDEKLGNLRALHAVRPVAALGWLGFLRSSVEKHAPQHLALIPDRLVEPERQRSTPDPYEQARIETADAFAKMQAQNRPAPISPEQLAAIRDANPQVQRARQTAEQLRKLDEAADADAPHDRKLRVVPDEPEDTPKWTPPWETETAA